MIHSRATIFIPTLVGPGVSRLQGHSFDRCKLVGPAMLKVQDRNRVNDNLLNESSVLEVPERTSIAGAILLFDCSFEHCLFKCVTFVDTPIGAARLRPVLAYATEEFWERNEGWLPPFTERKLS